MIDIDEEGLLQYDEKNDILYGGDDTGEYHRLKKQLKEEIAAEQAAEETKTL